MANSKIRGITIEIGGDTTKLDKALGSVDKKVKGTQVELREVNKNRPNQHGNVGTKAGPFDRRYF